MDLADMKADDQLGKADIERILNLSDMIYLRGVAASPVVSRQQKESIVDGGRSSTYQASSRFSITFQTGSDFIDPLNSYLCFTVYTAGAAGILQRSGAARLLQDVVIISRSGQELDRTENNSLLQYHLIAGLEAELQNYNYNGLFCTATANGSASSAPQRSNSIPASSGSAVRMCVPLKFVSPIFASAKLMPPHLARGLRIEALTETFARAFVGNTVTGYTISDVHCLLDCYSLADSVQAYLNQEWASTPDGLVYEFKSYNTSTASLASTSVSVEVRRACSMALSAFAVVRHDNAGGTQDAFRSVAVADSDIAQWRIGSTYLPSQSLTTIPKHYAQMLYWQSKLRHEVPSGVAYNDFIDVTDAHSNFGKYCVVLNRSNVLDLAGQSLNNSSTLSFNGTVSNAVAGDLVTVFMCHLRRAICFIENIVLET